jgi:hypothetical protein
MFFQNLTLDYMTKTLNHIIFFFFHQNQNTVFRCHSSEDFRIILSLHETEHEDNVSGIITIGTGFRDIVKLASGINTEQTTSDDVFDDDNPKQSAMKSYTHMLSWFARNWEYFIDDSYQVSVVAMFANRSGRNEQSS